MSLTGFAERPHPYANLAYLRLRMFPWQRAIFNTIRLFAEPRQFPSLETLIIECDTPSTRMEHSIQPNKYYNRRLCPTLLAIPTLKKVELRPPAFAEPRRTAERVYLLSVLVGLDARGMLTIS